MIYLDHNATTPILPEVRDTIREAMEKYWGNPSSTHSMGQKAFALLEQARERLAALIGAHAKEIFFTSGGTEADNLAILGMTAPCADGCVVISSIEHPAVHEAAHSLQNRGFTVRECPVGNDGIVLLDELERSLDRSTRLVSIMYANNEIGTIQPVREIGEVLERNGIPFHSDAVQAFGKIPIDVGKDHVTLMSISSHKIYGPKGCGALFIRGGGTKLSPRTFGGHQERGMRTGTENLPAILGFVKAAEISHHVMESERKRLFDLTELMYTEIAGKIENVLRNGHADARISGTLNLCIPGAETESMLASLDREGICASGGSACSSGSISASRTLLAIGRRKVDAVCAVRFSLGRENTVDDVHAAVAALQKAVARIRDINK
jgi:cysteine desulfurase